MTKKVAIIDHVGAKAGMDAYNLGLLGGLKENGVPAVVYSNFPSEEHDVHAWFKFRVKQNGWTILKLINSYRSLARELRSESINEIIVHGFRFGFIDWLLLKILYNHERKIYMIVHDPESLIGVKPVWKEKIFSLCSLLVVHNWFSYDELSKELSQKNRSKIVTIRHGKPVDVKSELTDENSGLSFRVDPTKKYLLFFGQIKQAKGLDILLEAMSMTNRVVHLIIAGRMRKHSFDLYQKIIEQKALADRIQHLDGYISNTLRDELFRAADIVVLPYRKVYQSGVLLMAMSKSKPVIVSDLPPNKEMISDGQNGMLFTAGDPKSLAEVIDRLAFDKDLCMRIGYAAREYVDKNLNWKMIAKEWKEVL